MGDSIEPVEYYVDPSDIDELHSNRVNVLNIPVSTLSIPEYGFIATPTAEYKLHFVTADSVENVSLPGGTLWANGEVPTLQPNTYYELSVVKTTIGEQSFFKAVLTPFKQYEKKSIIKYGG